MQEAVGGSAGGSAIGGSAGGSAIGAQACAPPRSIACSGWLPGGRFRHDATNRLPHDVVIVDETSMVPLSLMVRLVDAVRDDAQLVLVGDPDQLAAIEVGAVLRDIVGPAAEAPQFGPGMRAALARVTGTEPPGVAAARSFGDGVAVLRRGHRSVATISALAEAIRRGDADAPSPHSRPLRQHHLAEDLFGVWARCLREQAVAAYRPMIAAARVGDATTALHAARDFRLLCAHRHGPLGVAQWTENLESWLREDVDGLRAGRAALRRPAAARDPQRLRAAPAQRRHRALSCRARTASCARYSTPAARRSSSHHRGSATSSRCSPPPSTRARAPSSTSRRCCCRSRTRRCSRANCSTPRSHALADTLVLAGSEESVREAVARPAGRASGLQELLWSPHRTQS